VGLDRLQIAFITVVVVAAAAIGILGYGLSDQNKKISNVTYLNCQDNRHLIRGLLLQSIGATEKQWVDDEAAVLESIRQQTRAALEDAGRPVTVAKLDKEVSEAKKLIDFADPDACTRP